MPFGMSPTGAVVNATRIAVACVGVAAIVVSQLYVYKLLFGTSATTPTLEQWYPAFGMILAGLLLLQTAKHFTINSNPLYDPDVMFSLNEKNRPLDQIESLFRTIEAHTGSAAFFNRIGFSGLALGTICSAFAVLIVGMVAKNHEWLNDTQYTAFMDLAKLLFGAFVGSFAAKTAPNNSATSARPPAARAGDRPGQAESTDQQQR